MMPETRPEVMTWNWLAADSVCTKITKGTTPPKSDVSTTGTVPFIRVNNLTTGGSRSLAGDIIYVNEATHRTLLGRSVALPGDILMNIVGPPLGKVIKLNGEFPEYNLNQAILIYRSHPERINRDFFYYYLTSEVAQQWFEVRAKKTSGQKNLTIELCKQLPLPCPPLPEQKKIADIVSTWDRAIETTEKLLANAEAQKRALMQQLLTGRKRLPEFALKNWQRVKLGSLLKEVRRAVEWSDDELYSLLSLRRRSGGLFLREKLLGHDILTKGMKTTKEGDFLISKMQVVHGAMGMTSPEFNEMHISNSYISLVARDKDKIDIRFFDWLSRMPLMYRMAYLSSYGVHIEKMTFNLDWFLGEKISLPSTVAEQSRIADILDTSEKVVAALAAKKAKLAAEKRALIQQLLSGKRRVTV
jgi:type I restriction enzyme S subunit